MKLLEEAFTKGGGGHVRLVPDTPEDMWHVYNLIRIDDHVDAVTFRKVTRGGDGDGIGGGAAESERVKVRLRLKVEDVSYDGEGEACRVKGRNTTETEHVKLGAYHTLDLDVNRPVKIEKDEWDGLDIDRLRELADPAASAGEFIFNIICMGNYYDVVLLLFCRCVRVVNHRGTRQPGARGRERHGVQGQGGEGHAAQVGRRGDGLRKGVGHLPQERHGRVGE